MEKERQEVCWEDAAQTTAPEVCAFLRPHICPETHPQSHAPLDGVARGGRDLTTGQSYKSIICENLKQM